MTTGQRLCSITGCDSPSRSRGWCLRHWKRWRRYGDPAGGGPMRIADPMTRLLSRIQKTEDCWLWLGQVNNKGYGLFSLDGTKIGAHSASYRLHVGPVPDGLELDHLCRNPLCVRPSHLEPVTHAENQRRMGDARSHCIHGHPYTSDNTYRTPDGRKRCRACARERDRARASQRRAA